MFVLISGYPILDLGGVGGLKLNGLLLFNYALGYGAERAWGFPTEYVFPCCGLPILRFPIDV